MTCSCSCGLRRSTPISSSSRRAPGSAGSRTRPPGSAAARSSAVVAAQPVVGVDGMLLCVPERRGWVYADQVLVPPCRRTRSPRVRRVAEVDHRRAAAVVRIDQQVPVARRHRDAEVRRAVLAGRRARVVVRRPWVAELREQLAAAGLEEVHVPGLPFLLRAHAAGLDRGRRAAVAERLVDEVRDLAVPAERRRMPEVDVVLVVGPARVPCPGAPCGGRCSTPAPARRTRRRRSRAPGTS